MGFYVTDQNKVLFNNERNVMEARVSPKKLAKPGAQGATAVIQPPAVFLS